MPTLSVIVPIYNQEKYVEECLVSLLSQATDQVEYILMDDGSRDKSGEICRAVMARYPADARLIRQENQGLLATRRNGLALARGEYIWFVDSDDCAMPGAVAALLEAAGRGEFDVILFNATSRKESGTPLFVYPFPDGSVFTGEGKYDLYRLLCGTDRLNNIWAKCVRRALMEKEDVYRDIEGVSNGEDLYQSLALMDLADSVYFMDRVLYYYRVNLQSMSRSYNPRHFASEKKVCARRLAYAKKWSRGDDELTEGANRWIMRILRDVTRKLFVSDLPWSDIQREMTALRQDPFYRAHYLNARYDKNRRDLVLKSPLPLMRALKGLYAFGSGR